MMNCQRPVIAAGWERHSLGKMMTAKKKHILRFCISRLDERNHRTHEEVTEKNMVIHTNDKKKNQSCSSK